MKDLIWIENVPWMQRLHVRGIVLGRRVMFSDPLCFVQTRVFRHELQHVYQIRRDGMFMFYLRFFWYSLRHGYYDNPYEVEARFHQDDPLTTDEEDLLWKLRNRSMQLLNDSPQPSRRVILERS